MEHLQPIYDIAQLLSFHHISQAILCPGSRCAPLTMAFARHSKITTRTISDERSAAFIALGIAQEIENPVALVCTSGSAAYNFAPAVAEAYYQQVPLLLFTADRPTEWIDQWDGQTIQQENIFGRHVKKSFTFPSHFEPTDARWHAMRIINEAVLLSKEFPAGPVHINVPIREPLYPKADVALSYSEDLKIITANSALPSLPLSSLNHLQKELVNYKKTIVVAGQQPYQEDCIKSVEKFCKAYSAVLVGDIISNLHSAPDAILHADTFLGQCNESVKESLAPELLITFGKSVISKNLKLFLRRKNITHWHIQPGGYAPDTFQSLSRIIRCSPLSFFKDLSSEVPEQEDFHFQKKINFQRIWQAEEHRTLRSMKHFFETEETGEFITLNHLLSQLPQRCNLHLANSMSVRYANFIGLAAAQKGVHVFCNRGTSGIDGCTSTAVGHSLASEVPTILITGDMAFFYDRNAFWHTYALPNLHIIVLNNQGGVIFNLIDGPATLPEKDEYFITKQNLTASALCKEFGFTHLLLDTVKKRKNLIKDFLHFEGKIKILEILSTQETSTATFEHFKNTIKKGYETN